MERRDALRHVYTRDRRGHVVWVWPKHHDAGPKGDSEDAVHCAVVTTAPIATSMAAEPAKRAAASASIASTPIASAMSAAALATAALATAAAHAGDCAEQLRFRRGVQLDRCARSSRGCQ